MNKNLTVGKPQKVLWQFCLPLFGSVIFQQLYNIADSLVAGKFIGESALAAVGNSYEITLIFIAFAFGCNIGSSVIVSQFFGAKKYKEVKTAIYTAFIATGVLCTVLVVLGFLSCSWLLALINTPQEILADSKLYLDIYILGLWFLFFYNVSTGIFSALGDSRTPFIFLAISSTANILVDILFVTAFQMGVAGVAWATFLCQGVSCVLAVYAVLKRLKTIKTEGKVPFFSMDILKRIAVVAIPSILQQSFISVGNIVIQGVVNGFGASVIAGFAAATKLNNLVITSFTTLGNGMSNFTAQNMGAGRLARVKEGHRAGIRMVFVFYIPVLILYLTAGRMLVELFMDEPSMQALATGEQFLRMVAPFYILPAIKLITDGILRGAGLMKPFMIATFADLVIRVVLALVLSKFLGTVGIFSAWPIGWLIGTLLSVWFFGKGPWNQGKIVIDE